MSRSLRRTPYAPMLAALPLALVAALSGQTAHASGFQLKENSAEGLGRSFAGSAAAPGDCSVVVNNPAAMSESKTGCLQGDVTAIQFSAKFAVIATFGFFFLLEPCVELFLGKERCAVNALHLRA